MIIFLFGTWGCGKSHVADLIEKSCGLPHMEADLLFDEQMRQALVDREFHKLDLTLFFDRVLVEMRSYQRRSENFIVSQAIYREVYREMIYHAFVPDIRFVLVRTLEIDLQNSRLQARADLGNPITPRLAAYMQKYWELPMLPHDLLLNDESLSKKLTALMEEYGLYCEWGD